MTGDSVREVARVHGRPRLAGRVAATLMHACYAALGVISFASPAETVEHRVAALVYLWAGLFAVGGAVGGYGAIRRQWITERTAIYPEAVAVAVYAASLLARWLTDGSPAFAYLGVVFLALLASLAVRHSELTRISTASAGWRQEGGQ